MYQKYKPNPIEKEDAKSSNFWNTNQNCYCQVISCTETPENYMNLFWFRHL